MPEVKVSHPEKVLFPDDGITKGDLVEYYLTVADAMLPKIAKRPVSLERYPDGIGAKGFMQQNAPEYFPKWIERVTVPKAQKGTTTHVVCNHPEDLAYIANQNCITIHVWPSRVDDLGHPDYAVFDLDPAGDDVAGVVAAAKLTREVLGELGVPAWVKSTGSRGLHVVVPSDRTASTIECELFALDVSQLLVERDPEHLTGEWLVEDRGGRLLVDTARNKWAQMIAAPYTVRTKQGAPVSVPLAWEELDEPGFHPRVHTLRTVLERLASTPDPWADLEAGAVDLADALERLHAAHPDLVPAKPEFRPSRFGRKDKRLDR
jgi:bifunctional non-homologous end joining protein LigD